jgi:hydrogenase maturation protein HypF
MKTFHIHIKGIVQGVGFRPFVYKFARKENLKGWVNNTNDGVHIKINASNEKAEHFLNQILSNLPPLAIVTSSSIEKVATEIFNDFKIVKSQSKVKPNLLLTPDVAICQDCREELHHSKDRRYQYPFITCTNCGPRYSIISELPYDRPNTTMTDFKMCKTCQNEYDNPLERRHFSQTNSCHDCKIEMQLFQNKFLQENFTDVDYIVSQWKKGKIIAIKGIGGYLLTCDATNKDAVLKLRKRKQRPKKPFALMYPKTDFIQTDANLNKDEKKELESINAPIVLLEIKKENILATKEINSDLNRIGVMLPYTPLYELLLGKFKKPIVATSGNITDSTIIYTDKKAIEELSKIADIILLNNRDIVLPQDDGVVQFTKKHHQKITLRRSRGKAPTYINKNLNLPKETIFAAGSMLKSTFGLLNMQNTYISQYLGNTASYESQINYETTYNHFEKIFQLNINKVVVDKHPDYFATRFGKNLADRHQADVIELQHHKAHFYSVLGENNLLNAKEAVLGIVWDGTGLGDDGNIWGGEFFIYKNKKVKRAHHIGEFDFILADKMVKEPRISALAIAHKIEGMNSFIKDKFTETEFKIYQKLLQNTQLKSTSMGRLFDAVSSVLLGNDIHSFEAEASMRLEQSAASYYYKNKPRLKDSYITNGFLPKNLSYFLMKNIFNDLQKNKDKEYIAFRFHLSLVIYILTVAKDLKIDQIAFSGGVFQNALLVDLLHDYLKPKYHLYFQNEFSANDEGIPFGQLMYATILNKT